MWCSGRTIIFTPQDFRRDVIGRTTEGGRGLANLKPLLLLPSGQKAIGLVEQSLMDSKKENKINLMYMRTDNHNNLFFLNYKLNQMLNNPW